jgi:hypothetical protein
MAFEGSRLGAGNITIAGQTYDIVAEGRGGRARSLSNTNGQQYPVDFTAEGT